MKKKKVNNIYTGFLFAFIFFNTRATSQVVQNYRFTVAEKIIIDSTTGFYKGAEFEFVNTRIYISDTTFVDKGLFKIDDENPVFKIANNEWYVKRKCKWKLFYSPYKNVTPQVQIGSIKYKLISMDTASFRKYPCTVYRLSTSSGNLSGEIFYWFNPLRGFIIIETDNIKLIRQDIVQGE